MASETEDLNDSWVELHFNKTKVAKDSSIDTKTGLTSDAQTDLMMDAHADLSDLLSRTQMCTTETPWLAGSQTDPTMSYTGTSLMEKLLIDAQRESRNPSTVQSREPSCNVSRIQSRDPSRNVSRTASRPESKGSSLGGSSPKCPQSPTSSPPPEWSSEGWRSRDPGTEWIWDWSSRPELVQSFDNLNERFRHPMRKKRPVLSIRNSNIMRKTNLFSWSNLPTLLLTHAATFFLGAAAVIIYVKKYCNFPAITPATLSALD